MLYRRLGARPRRPQTERGGQRLHRPDQAHPRFPPSPYNKASFLENPDIPWEEIERVFGDTLHDHPPHRPPAFGENSGELTVPNSDKAYAIDTLIQHLGISRENTYAFGRRE